MHPVPKQILHECSECVQCLLDNIYISRIGEEIHIPARVQKSQGGSGVN